MRDPNDTTQEIVTQQYQLIFERWDENLKRWASDGRDPLEHKPLGLFPCYHSEDEVVYLDKVGSEVRLNIIESLFNEV